MASIYIPEFYQIIFATANNNRLILLVNCDIGNILLLGNYCFLLIIRFVYNDYIIVYLDV